MRFFADNHDYAQSVRNQKEEYLNEYHTDPLALDPRFRV